MKRRSIGGFVTGLVGILLGVPIGFYAYIILALIFGFGGFDAFEYTVLLFFIAEIFAIVGVCFYFVKARVGAILMLIATLSFFIPFACGLYAVLSKSNLTIETLIAFIIGNIPTILFLISTILGFCAKARVKISPETQQ